MADLAEAKTLLPNNLVDIGRATKLAAAGLQARVALYMGDWANAVTYSTEYINGLPLATRANFPGIWTDANTSELAFKLKRTASVGGRIGNLFRGNNSSSASIGQIVWLPSDKLYNTYDQTNDIRFSSYFRTDATLATAGRPSKLIRKYEGTGYGTTDNVTDAKVFRTGEMYLIRAEARAELGSFTGANSAESDINDLRAARITGYTNVTFASKAAAIAAIIDERFKELAYEGHRYWDLKRRSLPVVRLASDAPNANAITLPADNFRFTLPIPLSEMQANPLMVQNPGYN
jgi:starch-binding outer membrane protein, SusD/RagB family